MVIEHRELKSVVVLVHEGCELIDFAGPAAMFGRAHDDAGALAYSVIIATVDGLPVRTIEGVRVAADVSVVSAPESIDTLVVAGGMGIDAALSSRGLIGAVRSFAERSRRVVGVCTGAFLLAEAGLLRGRQATTHWAATARLEARYGEVEVVDGVVWTSDREVSTSAGATTGIDLALALIEEDLGPQAARRLAKWMVVFARRPPGQAQISVRNELPERPVNRLRRSVDAVVADPTSDLSITAMARAAALSPRHFARLFKQTFDTTPARYVERVRVERAQQLIEASSATLSVVAQAAGFSSTETMRRAFRRTFGRPPGSFRPT